MLWGRSTESRMENDTPDCSSEQFEPLRLVTQLFSEKPPHILSSPLHLPHKHHLLKAHVLLRSLQARHAACLIFRSLWPCIIPKPPNSSCYSLAPRGPITSAFCAGSSVQGVAVMVHDMLSCRAVAPGCAAQGEPLCKVTGKNSKAVCSQAQSKQFAVT